METKLEKQVGPNEATDQLAEERWPILENLGENTMLTCRDQEKNRVLLHNVFEAFLWQITEFRRYP
jgi:hypothetical protein